MHKNALKPGFIGLEAPDNVNADNKTLNIINYPKGSITALSELEVN